MTLGQPAGDEAVIDSCPTGNNVRNHEAMHESSGFVSLSEDGTICM